MDLFIGNLPSNITLGELTAYFKGFTNKADFHLKQRTLDNGEKLRYAVISFVNDKYALKLIEKYSGQSFRGNTLHIREYFHRSYNNERRAVNWREKPWRAGERRRDDRRYMEHAVKTDDEFEQILASTASDKQDEADASVTRIRIEGYDSFARKN